ncbi:hypothetical protein COHA_009327 [Chlorella ohadii]|uniref:NAD(P)-binding domain-containing protein n=1 Tax=Chlorella ohadii TaxID=2649997 RepID=A0AAD5GXZ0_9CHLO|nr:hypothetical protein COHA_009327 [Chlorella ohadii]
MQQLASSTHLRGTGLAARRGAQSQPARLSRGAAVVVRAEEGKKGGFFGFGAPKPGGTQKVVAADQRSNGKPEPEQKVGLVGTIFKSRAGTQASGTQVSRRGGRGRDASTVFVAGSTGRLGARIVRELLGKGFKVRAGVRNPDKADTFLEIASSYGLLSKDELGRLTVVECDLERPETIAPAIGGAAKVVCAVGAAESELGDVSAPRRIDGEGATRLVEAANAAGVQQFVLVTSLGTGKIGFPAGILNLFGGVLTFKRKAEEALEASGMPYTIVRPGGMEAPRDDHKLTHNMRLATRDKLFGGTVSRLQVAELIAACVESPELAENKCLEVVSETAAPALSYEELLEAHPSEATQEEREAEREAAAALQVEIEEARETIAAAEDRLAEIRERIKTATSEAGALKQAEAAVRKEQAEVIKQAERAEKQLAALVAESEKKALLAAAARAVVAEAQKAQREGRLLSRDEVAAIKRDVLNPPKPEPKVAPAAAAAVGAALPFFGKRAPAPVEEEEEEEEEEEVVAAPAKPAFGLFGFGRKPQPEEVVVEEEVVVVAQKKPSLFGSFFKKVEQVAEEEEEVEEEEEEEEEAAAAPPARQQQQRPAFAFFGGKKAEAPAAAEEEEEEEAVAPKAAAAAAAAASAAAAKQAADQAAAKKAAEQAAARQRAEQEAAAAKAAAEAEAAKASLSAEEQEAARKKAEEEEAELAARRAAAEAKRRAEEEAIAARLAAEAAAKQAEAEAKKAAERKAALEAAAKALAAKQAAAEKAAVQPAAAPTPAAASGTLDNVAEARQWIANWKASQGSKPAQQAQQAQQGGDVPANVAEARAWIGAWKSKQK